ATTDAKGRYRLDGAPKMRQYMVSAAAGDTHFNSTKLDVSDTPGLDPLTVDFELEQGILIRGRLTDKVTGKPVRGWVRYCPSLDNPNLKDFADFNKLQLLAKNQGEVGPDGSFTVLAIPGQGALCAHARDAGRYVREKPPEIKLGKLLLQS